MRRGQVDRTALAAELAGLPHLADADLRSRWRDLFGHPPPRLGRGLLAAAVAYRLQEKALGGLKPSVRRMLAQAAGHAAAGRPVAPPPPIAKAGTCLIRQWHGEVHEVAVLDDGVLYRGERYRSLSQVARAITGVRWSGPRFFGLQGKEAADAADQA